MKVHCSYFTHTFRFINKMSVKLGAQKNRCVSILSFIATNLMNSIICISHMTLKLLQLCFYLKQTSDLARKLSTEFSTGIHTGLKST